MTRRRRLLRRIGGRYSGSEQRQARKWRCRQGRQLRRRLAAILNAPLPAEWPAHELPLVDPPRRRHPDPRLLRPGVGEDQ
jgi:hypothetical protein